MSEHSPAAWSRIDDPHGYRIRYPPGWTARQEAERLTVTSPDGQALLLVRTHAEDCAKVEATTQRPLRPNMLPAESAPRHVAGELRPAKERFAWVPSGITAPARRRRMRPLALRRH